MSPESIHSDPVESAQEPTPLTEDSPLIDGAPDLHALWCTAQACDNIAESRELRNGADRRLSDLERRHG